MSTMILDGKMVASHLRSQLKTKVQQLMTKLQRPPCLTVVLVGEDPASQVYVRNKIKACADVGIHSEQKKLPATTTQAQLRELILQLNADDSVDGILVQLPLPKGLDEDEINEILSAKKDVDGFTYPALGHLWAGTPFVAPCTPQGVMSLLQHYGISVAGKDCVVVGRSNIVGKPMAHLLSQADATVTLCHSKTQNLRAHLQRADVVVVAAGRREFLGKDDFKQGAIVVDVGMHGSGQGKSLAGDVRTSELMGWAKAITPVPGGVGPMTIATLLENTVALAERRISTAEKKQR